MKISTKFMLTWWHLYCPSLIVYYITQVISADLFSHPKVREMFRKSHEINQIHFYEVKDEKLTEEKSTFPNQ